MNKYYINLDKIISILLYKSPVSLVLLVFDEEHYYHLEVAGSLLLEYCVQPSEVE